MSFKEESVSKMYTYVDVGMLLWQSSDSNYAPSSVIEIKPENQNPFNHNTSQYISTRACSDDQLHNAD